MGIGQLLGSNFLLEEGFRKWKNDVAGSSMTDRRYDDMSLEFDLGVKVNIQGYVLS